MTASPSPLTPAQSSGTRDQVNESITLGSRIGSVTTLSRFPSNTTGPTTTKMAAAKLFHPAVEMLLHRTPIQLKQFRDLTQIPIRPVDQHHHHPLTMRQLSQCPLQTRLHHRLHIPTRQNLKPTNRN
jgi:hypothetical protein